MPDTATRRSLMVPVDPRAYPLPLALEPRPLRHAKAAEGNDMRDFRSFITVLLAVATLMLANALAIIYLAG